MSHTPHELQVALPERYRVEKEIGRGGMATVYLADDAQLDRRVAIKVLHPDLASSLGADRFAREIKVLAQLSHPHILPVLDSGGSNSVLYYVMPYVEGESLRDRLDREHQLAIEDAVGIVCEVADALSYAHAAGIIHRDIKPENILLSDGHAVVADFGIARLADESAEKLTMTGMSLGTAAYMSPEQASGEKVDGRADLYSLACLLYELLVGSPPFSGANAMAVMARHAMEPPPGIRVVRSAVPEELEAVVMQALEKSAADRFKTVGEFKRALLGESATSHTTRYTARYTAGQRLIPAPAVPWWSRHPLLTAAAGLFVVSGSIAVAMSGVLQANQSMPENAARVAITYFTDAPGSDLRYLADAVTENLVQELGAAAVDVASLNAVHAFRGINVPADSIGRALDAGTIVRGSLEPDGDGVRVTVQLWDVIEGELDRKTFRSSSVSPVQLQGQVVSHVADMIRQRVGRQLEMREHGLGTTSAEAWTLFRRAELLRKSADSLAAASASTQAATTLAAADSLLARAEQLDGAWGAVATRRAMVALAKGRALRATPDRSVLLGIIDGGVGHADRALRMDPRDADALTARGELLHLKFATRLIGDPAAAERVLVDAESSLVRAVRVNEDQADAWGTLSAIYYRKPDMQAVVNAAYQALRADKYLASARTVQARLFYARYNTEDFAGAMSTCDDGRRRFPADPTFVQCRLFLYMSPRAGTPRPDSAWAYAAQWVELNAAERRALARKRADVLVAGALVAAGMPDSARRVLDRARATPALDPTRSVMGWEAAVRLMLGEKDTAVDLLRDYLVANPEHKSGFAARTSWWWRDIQDHPRFRALIAGS